MDSATTHMFVTTESGAQYEFNADLTSVRRVSDTYEMRADNHWVPCSLCAPIAVGEPLILVLQGIAPDADFTLRVSTPVVSGGTGLVPSLTMN